MKINLTNQSKTKQKQTDSERHHDTRTYNLQCIYAKLTTSRTLMVPEIVDRERSATMHQVDSGGGLAASHFSGTQIISHGSH